MNQGAQEATVRWAMAYREAVQAYWDQDPELTRPPRDVDICKMHDPPLEPRGWAHRKRRLRGLDPKHPGRDWIETWPPPRDWRPSWEDEVPRQPPLLPSEKKLGRIVTEEWVDDDGNVVRKRILRSLSNLAIVAASYGLLDISDGRFDFTIHLCKLLAGGMPKLA